MTTSSSQIDSAVTEPPPTHRVHQSSDQLPTRSSGLAQDAPGGGYATQYMADNPELAGDDTSRTATVGFGDKTNGHRPLDTQPVPEGGIARGGNEGLPQGKASITDKLVGKTEKVAGKLRKDPELHERGELREAGGKAAAIGEARAPHD